MRAIEEGIASLVILQGCAWIGGASRPGFPVIESSTEQSPGGAQETNSEGLERSAGASVFPPRRRGPSTTVRRLEFRVAGKPGFRTTILAGCRSRDEVSSDWPHPTLQKETRSWVQWPEASRTSYSSDHRGLRRIGFGKQKRRSGFPSLSIQRPAVSVPGLSQREPEPGRVVSFLRPYSIITCSWACAINRLEFSKVIACSASSSGSHR